MRLSVNDSSDNNVTAIEDNRNRSEVSLYILILIGAISVTALLTWGGLHIGFGTSIALLGILILIALIIRWPIVGFFTIATCTVLIESGPLFTPIFTDQLYVYYWPQNLAGLFERPIGFLMLFVFFVICCTAFVRRQKLLKLGELFWPFTFFLLCVVMGVIHGMTSGGDTKIIVLEVRPLWYMFLSYLLAYNLIKSKKEVRTLFWIMIICAGIKAFQGMYIYYGVLHGDLTQHREIMAHEESFFFVAILLLIILFNFHYRYRPQLFAALLLVPPIIITLIANQRRTDYIALLIGLVVAWACVFMVKPSARKGLIIAFVIFAAIGTAYVFAFANSSGGTGEPARAIISIFHPDPKDASSNLYRDIENFDLKYTVTRNQLIGYGFGKQFLQPITLPNILSLDPYYLYIPHNTIYWIWMRLGFTGYFFLWYLFGAIIIKGIQIVRQLKDHYLQTVAIFVVSITVMEVVVAYADYQLYFYRNVIYLGLLVGLLMKLPYLDQKKDSIVNETTHDNTELSLAQLGS